jgi:hypothetical protein
VLEITLTWVSGYRHSHRGRNNAPFIRSITHAPDQTYIRLQHLHCLFDLAISPPFWIIAWIETIFMEFRGPKALVNLHGCRQIGHLVRSVTLSILPGSRSTRVTVASREVSCTARSSRSGTPAGAASDGLADPGEFLRWRGGPSSGDPGRPGRGWWRGCRSSRFPGYGIGGLVSWGNYGSEQLKNF